MPSNRKAIYLLAGDKLHTEGSKLYYEDEGAGVSKLYEAWDEFKNAERYLLEVIDSQRAKLGANHIETLTTSINLAYCTEKQDRLDEARAIYATCLTGFAESLGWTHRKTQALAHMRLNFALSLMCNMPGGCGGIWGCSVAVE